MKPLDRDANASKDDEPNVPSLLDYTDPDKVIAAILMGNVESISSNLNVSREPSCSKTDPVSREPSCSKTDPDHSRLVNARSEGVQNSIFPCHSRNKKSRAHADSWVSSGHDGIWSWLHSVRRRSLATPSECAEEYTDHGDQDQLSSIRYTLGRYDDGKSFSFTDSWRNKEQSHIELRRPWTGITFCSLVIAIASMII